MEFTRLAEVEVVETANNTDKVLIEQNGEIKRVPKTEVGGSGGGMLIVTHAGVTDPTMAESMVFTTNMTLTEAIEAFNKQELTGGVLYITPPTEPAMCLPLMLSNATALVGFECMVLFDAIMDLTLFWTEAGISDQPPM
jgi:hypothetical protein